MKIFAVFFTLCIASTLAGISVEKRAKLLEYRGACTAETGVSDAAIDNAKAGVFATDDDKLKCFAFCLMKKIGFVNAAGELDEAVLRAKIPADYPTADADKLINQCTPLTGANACETAGKRFKCFLEHKTIPILV